MQTAADWLVWITETLGSDRALLVELADVADVQVRKSDVRVDADVDDVTTAPALTELSRSWCEQDTLASESVYYTIILRAIPAVVPELRERCCDSLCVNVFGPTHVVENSIDAQRHEGSSAVELSRQLLVLQRPCGIHNP